MKKMIIVVTLSVIFQGCTVSNNIISDIKQLRGKNNTANIDISNIARKYIAVGEHKSTVENYLMTNGFSLYYQSVAPDDTVSLVAVYDGSRIALIKFFGFYDEVRITIVFENNVVKSVNGKLIYLAL